MGSKYANYAKTPIVLQMEAAECGAASLAMILSYYGKDVPLEQLRIEVDVSRDGCNAANLIRAGSLFGLRGQGYKKKAEALCELQMPCLLFWEQKHFVVLEGFKGKFVYINDPAIGRRKLTMEELKSGYSNVALTFTKAEGFVPEKKKDTFFLFIKEHLKGQKEVWLRLLFAGFFLIFPGVGFALTAKTFFDEVLIRGNIGNIMKILVFMGCCLITKLCVIYYRSLILQGFRIKMILLSGFGFLHHMFRLPIRFFNQRFTGELVSRMDSHKQVYEFLTGDLAEILLNLFSALVYFVLLIFYSPSMAFIAFCGIAALVLFLFCGSKATERYTMQLLIEKSKLYGTLCVGIQMTDTIKVSGAEQEYASHLLERQDDISNIEKKVGYIQKAMEVFPFITRCITDGLFLVFGGIFIINGNMTVGNMAAFYMLFVFFCEPIHELFSYSKVIQKMKADIQRIEDILNYPQDVVFNKEACMDLKHKLDGMVELKDVTFGYSTLKDPFIRSFSVQINTGETIAFVGASGCGKSTIAKIISGLYQPWSGSVYMNHISLDQIPKEIINASIATVDQNITLFAGTIKENLTMWNPAILEADMIQAAKDACIHDKIMQQKEGYEYRLTEGALNLSGGERQRLEIARALAAKPSILIMDEATSALDPIVEKQVLDNIKKRGCTCIMIAHRLSTVRDCNQIIVMEQGKIVERGTHKELVKMNGYYRAFIQNI